MKKTRTLLCALLPAVLLFVASPAAHARAAPLYNPLPIDAPCKLSIDKVKTAVRNAAIARGWAPLEKGSGHIEARLDVRKHTAVVDIRYDTKSVTIKYKTSNVLGHEVVNGVEQIHPNYNGWVQNLEKDIRVHLNNSC